MSRGATWTKAENLAIYMFITMYPKKSDSAIARDMINNTWFKTNVFEPNRSYTAIRLHVGELRKPYNLNELFVPDYKNRDVNIIKEGFDIFGSE